MENQKYILGLDISTSTIGICLFEDLGTQGKLIKLTHLEPKINPIPPTQLERLKDKADMCIEKIIEMFKDYYITRIVVEEPLFNSINQKIALTLEMFNEYITSKLGLHFGLKVSYITVHQSRKFGLPELLSKKGSLMSDFPSKIAGLPKTKWQKFLIMYLVSQRFKGIKWILNSKLQICKKNFDRADSIVTTLGYMLKENLWTDMKSKDFWKSCDLSYDTCIKIIGKNIAYEKFCKDHVDKDKKLSKIEKNKAKTKYLNEVFEIHNYLNV